MSGEARYRRELLAVPALVERILSELPPVPEEPESVTVGGRRADGERGIARALALAVAGVSARVELIEAN
jgi:hypothetical protein